jgi:hypothetical protein
MGLDDVLVMNMLDTKPRKNCRWRRDPDGNVILEVERFHRPWSRRLARFFDLKPRRKVHLDSRGSSTWTLCDGSRTVEQIGKVLESQFGPDEHLYPRLATFLNMLETNGLMDIHREPDRSGARRSEKK